MEKLEAELKRISAAWHAACDRHVLSLQVPANVAAAAIAGACGIIALLLLHSGGLAPVLGFVIGVAGFGAAGLALALCAAAVHRRAYFPPSSSYEQPWHNAWKFLQHNFRAAAGGFGVCYSIFILLFCLLLIPAGVARLSEQAQHLFAVLLVPLALIAAAGVLAVIYGVFVVSAEVALNERSLAATLRAVFGRSPCRCCSLLRSFAGALAAAFLAALPPVALLALSLAVLKVAATVVAGINFTSGARIVMMSFALILLAAAAAPATALFTVMIGDAWRDLCELEETDEESIPPETPNPKEQT